MRRSLCRRSALGHPTTGSACSGHPHPRAEPGRRCGHDRPGADSLAPHGHQRLRRGCRRAVARLGALGPRWVLLFRLLAEERCGCGEGISPTHLSQRQNVSKNTISVLLRGLEEQGLIERTLVPDDRRAFQIRLTAAGRTLVETTAPAHIAFLNEMTAGLTARGKRSAHRPVAETASVVVVRGQGTGIRGQGTGDRSLTYT